MVYVTKKHVPLYPLSSLTNSPASSSNIPSATVSYPEAIQHNGDDAPQNCAEVYTLV